ncbi:AI-2E family transporter [Caulobacter sp. KR2-114]|uniref:AI-2E family transporter n=1 Tax=Caulobacter sp. KR2-114 TaxID=3400912 RepID=UPI003C0A21C8
MTDPVAAPGPAGRAPAALSGFAARMVVAVAVIAAALLLWRMREAAAIGLGSVVLGLGFSGLADSLSRRLRLPRPLALALGVAVVIGAVGLTLEVFGATLAGQFDVLSHKLPAGLRQIAGHMNATAFGHELLLQARGGAVTLLAGNAPRLAAGLIATLGKTLTYVLVMLLGGVFLAADPARYRRGLLRLAPPSRRARYGEVADRLATALRRWLAGRMVVMAVVGVLSSLGLWALGIDAPVALGLTGAVLSFIPNLGSVIATLPAMLIGFLQEPIKAVAVAVVIWAVHFLDGAFITPKVQDEAADVPPVISVFSTVVFALLLGPVGVFLTGPITVAVLVLVQCLYLEDMLGEPVPTRSAKARPDLLRWLRARPARP